MTIDSAWTTTSWPSSSPLTTDAVEDDVDVDVDAAAAAAVDDDDIDGHILANLSLLSSDATE